MNGRETLIRIRQAQPLLPVIVMSGFTFDCEEWDADDHLRPDAVLQKPFRVDQLCRLIDAVGSGENDAPERASLE